MKIEAALTRAAGAGFELAGLELDAPRAGEVLVRVAAAGVCHTDLTCADGGFPVHVPIVLGHEGAGVVEEVGDGVTGFEAGDHVVMSFDSCGGCASCRAGMPAYCASFAALNFGGGRADGSTALRDNGVPVHSHFFGQSSLASHAIARARGLVKIDPDIPFEVAAPLACGVQTGAGAILNVLHVRPGSTVAVIGAGGVGLGAALAARLAGASQVVVVDPVPARRELACSIVADAALDPLVDGFSAELAHLAPQYAVDTSGKPATVATVFDALSPAGALAVIGAAGSTEFSFDIYQLLNGKSVRGLTMGEAVPQSFVPMLLGHWRAGRFPVDRLVSTFPFGSVAEAIAAMRGHEVVKPVLTP